MILLQICTGFHVSHITMKFKFPQQILEKCPNIKFHEIPFSWRPAVQLGRADMKDLVVAFHNFANSPKINFYVTANILH
jgi:hypothetical protein